MSLTIRGGTALGWGVSALLTLLSTPALAQAEPAEPVAADSEAFAPPKPVERPHRIVWHYPRFRWWEYAAAGAVAVGNVSLEILYKSHPEDKWNGPILADATVRKWLLVEDPAAQRKANQLSDFGWYGSTWYVLLDGIITPLASDRLNADVAFQLTLLNWQAIGLSGLLARLAHDTAGRSRPSLQGCSDEPESTNKCEFRGASFVAGHAMMTSANAGLACANHYALPLYGGGVADALVCPVMVTTALSVGVLRMIADKHWFSDTVVGWAAGGSIGFGLPWLLHYGPTAVRRVASPFPDTALVPWVDEKSGGLQLIGRL
jgi:hypothetical protein